LRKEGNHKQPLMGFRGAGTRPTITPILTYRWLHVNSTHVPLHISIAFQLHFSHISMDNPLGLDTSLRSYSAGAEFATFM